MINKPTQITDCSHTIIDNIFVSNPADVSSGVIVSDVSDHFPILLISRQFLTNFPQPVSPEISYRDLNRDNLQNIYNKLSHRGVARGGGHGDHAPPQSLSNI